MLRESVLECGHDGGEMSRVGSIPSKTSPEASEVTVLV